MVSVYNPWNQWEKIGDASLLDNGRTESYRIKEILTINY